MSTKKSAKKKIAASDLNLTIGEIKAEKLIPGKLQEGRNLEHPVDLRRDKAGYWHARLVEPVKVGEGSTAGLALRALRDHLQDVADSINDEV